MSAYTPQQHLAAAARPHHSLPRLFSGIVLFIVAFFILNITYSAGLIAISGDADLSDEILSGTTPLGIWMNLGAFVCIVLALWVVLQLVHQRGMSSLLGPWRPMLKHFAVTTRALVLLFAVLLILPTPERFAPLPNIPFGAWLALLPLSIPLLFLQISAEELVFRGYLQSQLSARFNSPLVWMVLPSVLFGALHYDVGTYGTNAWAVAAWAGVFGLAAADLTARTGTLGAALSLHFVNNFSAILIAGMRNHWDGVALWSLPFDPSDTDTVAALMPAEALIILCAWLTARLALRR